MFACGLLKQSLLGTVEFHGWVRATNFDSKEKGYDTSVLTESLTIHPTVYCAVEMLTIISLHGLGCVVLLANIFRVIIYD